MVGRSEISYLAQLDPEARDRSLHNLDLDNICCIIVANVTHAPDELVKLADSYKVPLLQTRTVSSRAISFITDFLQEALAPAQTIHGVLMEMYGIGVLILGESGIGKSECALDLITRGHRLVADDMVQIKMVGKHLDGEAPLLTAEHLEIRGLGIINVRDLFGVSSVCERIRIALCVELRRHADVINIDRIGLEKHEHEFFGIKRDKFILPVSSGRNVSTLVETAVRLFLLRDSGSEGSFETLIERHTAIVGGPN
jgi:HPr kinase/phosphorylase